VTGRKPDTAKRERIADLLRKGVETTAIVTRLGCHKDLVHQVRKEMKGQTP
jgi:DNA invertase Pin-like site-specific DNA recombinase